MAKTKISEYSATAGNNTDINSINLAEGMAPSLVNNAIRQLMAQLKDFQAGTAGDSVTVGGNLSVTGTSTLTGAITATGGVSGAVTSSSATITGGTITGITDLAVADGGTGASTAANARTNLSAASSGANSDITSITGLTTALTVLQGGTGVTTSTGTGNVVLSTSPTLVTPALGTPSALVGTNITGTASGLTAGNVTTNANLTGGVTSVGNAATVVTNANLTGAVTSVGNATSLGSFTSAQLLGALTDETGTGSAVFATSPTLVTPALGTPSALVGTNITGTASGLTAGNVTTNANLTGAITSVGNATSLGSFTSANLLAALTDETGTGSAVFATSPTLVTPILGTPTSATLTNATGLPISTGVSGLGTGVATALAVNVGSAGAPLVNGGVLGTPSSGTATNLTGLPISTGVSGLGTGVATALAVNVGSAGAAVVNGGALGTPSGGTATNLTGLPLSTGVTGTLPVANGGTGTATPSLVQGTNVTITGTWPNQTIAASGGGTPAGSNTQVQYNNAGAFGGITGATTNGTALTLVAPVLGTPASVTLTNATGLPLSTGVTGNLPVTNLNSGTGATSSTFWRGDGVWSSPAGGGDVVGPASSTDNAFARFDSTTGKLLQNSTGATLSDTGAAVFTGALDVLGNSTAGSNLKLYEDTDNGTNYVSFKAPDTIASNVTWTLPAADGTSAQVLSTNGSGTLSWATASGSSQWTTTGSDIYYNTGVVAIGTSTPSAWSIGSVLQVKRASFYTYDNSSLEISQNGAVISGAWQRIGTDFATKYGQDAGNHTFYTAVSSSAGSAITWTQSLAFGKGKSLALEGATSATGIGIAFPATQSASSDANTLDDYEEGTWTPTVGGTATHTSQDGQYVKIGRLVYASFDIVIGVIGTGSTTAISGLPFASGGVSNGQAGLVSLWSSLAIASSAIYLRVDTGATTINTASTTGNQTGITVNPAIFGNSSRLIGTAIYYANA